MKATAETGGKGGRAGGGVSDHGRARLQEYLSEGLGDHILYLRIFQVTLLPRHSPLQLCST